MFERIPKSNQSRGVKQVPLFVIDSLSGLDKAVHRLIYLPTDDSCRKLVYYKVIQYNEIWSTKTQILDNIAIRLTSYIKQYNIININIY